MNKKIMLDLNENLIKLIKKEALNQGRSMNKQILYDLTRYSKYNTAELDNTIEPDALVLCTPYGLQQTDIKAPPAVVNRFFIKKDEFNKDVFNVDFFNVDGIKKLLQENYATKQEFYKYLKIKIVELNILNETIQDLESWKGEPMVDLIIDEIIKFLKA